MFGLRRGRRASRGGPGGAAAAFLAGRPVLGAAPATAGPRLRRRNRGGAGGARAEAEEGAPGGKPDGEAGGEPAAPPPPPPPGPPPQQPQGYVMSGEDPAAPADEDGRGLTRACPAAEQKAKLRAEYLGVGVSAGGPTPRGRPRRD